MAKHVKHVPTHRGAPKRPNGAKIMRNSAAGVAVAATGLAVSGGVLTSSPVIAAQSAELGASLDGVVAAGGAAGGGSAATVDLPGRARDQVSRSDRRSGARNAKATALGTAEGAGMAESEDLSAADPRTIGRALLAEYGFADSQFGCLDSLYVSESNWRVDADNPTSSAYGIPQALTSMHELPADYMTSAESQIRWGLEYIQRAYGSPCNAWAFKQGHNWY